MPDLTFPPPQLLLSLLALTHGASTVCSVYAAMEVNSDYRRVAGLCTASSGGSLICLVERRFSIENLGGLGGEGNNSLF